MTAGPVHPQGPFDYWDPTQDRHAVWREMREHCPIVHSERHGGYWIVSKAEDIEAIARDPATFSSRYLVIPKPQTGLGPLKSPINLDPPAHGPYKEPFLRLFSPAAVVEWEPFVRESCQALLDGLTARNHAEACNEYSRPIVVQFTVKLLGIPAEDEDRFIGWVHRLTEVVVTDDDRSSLIATYADITGYLLDQIAEKRQTRTEDLLSFLVSSAETLGADDQTLVGSALMFILAGTDTTFNAISSSLFHLATHDDDRRRLVADPALIPVAVEELLRYYAPATLARVITRDTEFKGCPMAEGEMVLLPWGSANRDPDRFADPDKVVIDRAENNHLTFGLGPHRCLGSNFARMEMRIALEEWLRHIPEFKLADPDAVRWSVGPTWGPRHLPLAY
jgi:hypothetical protein